jgi:hypothetical protein
MNPAGGWRRCAPSTCIERLGGRGWRVTSGDEAPRLRHRRQTVAGSGSLQRPGIASQGRLLRLLRTTLQARFSPRHARKKQAPSPAPTSAMVLWCDVWSGIPTIPPVSRHYLHNGSSSSTI